MERATQSQILEDYIEERQREESQQLQGKKRFLKEQILDVYQQDEQRVDLFLDFFLLYLRRNKGIDTKDHNLELLSLAQLTQLVEEFRTAHPPSVPPVEVENSLDVSMSRIAERQRFDAQKVHYGNGSWDYELEGYQQCKRVKPFFPLELAQAGRNSVMVVFDKQELRKVGGFFGIGKRTQLWIEMRCNLFKEPTSRCIQDFIALRKLLLSAFPFAFMYPLETAQRLVDRVSEEGARSAVAAECRRFITHVCRDEQLLQCFFTHRFFKDPKSFAAFAQTHQKSPACKIKDIENTAGCLQIEISDRNELTKRDYSRKGELLEQLYSKIEESNQRIAGKLREAQAQVERQQQMMQQVVVQLTTANPALRDGYKDVSALLGGCRELVKQCGQSLGSWLFLMQACSLQLAAPSRYSWTCFGNYAKDINGLSHEYSVRRKVFLQKQARRLQGKEGEGKQQAGTAQFTQINQSVISNLGISANSAKETVWIQRCSKWQGYMNSQFTASFERLLQNDQEALRNLIKEATATRREMQKQEEAVITGLQPLI